MVNKNFLICLAGLPASGKTSFAKILKRILEKRLKDFSIRIIDPDIIRRVITPDKFDYKLESSVRKRNLAEISKELSKGNIVISDDLNYYSSMRHDLKTLAENYQISFFIIYISTPFETCLIWNKNRGEPIPNKVISNIYTKFDDFGKYQWDYPIEKFDLSRIKDINNEIENLVNILMKELSRSQKISQKEKRSEDSLNRDNQNLDKLTRIYVGKLLRNPKFRPMKKKIIKSRKRFVKLYKNKALNEHEIVMAFKKFLEANLMKNLSD